MESKDALATALTAALGAPITELTRLTAGASMESWAFQAADRPLILRRAPGGATDASGLGAISLSTEAATIDAARCAGVCAPDVVHVFAPDAPIGAGYVMNRLPGEALPPRLFRDSGLAPVLDALPERLAREMAAIHAVPTDSLPDLPHLGARALIAEYRKPYAALGQRRPVYELAFAWLEENCPERYDPPVLVHGDFRMGNLLIDHTGLTAVLDWELCHLGDPHQDLAYICAPSWRFGRREKTVGGIGALEPFLDAYEAASGHSVDRARFDVWRVLTTLFWGSACMSMLNAWRDGHERTVERAAIGRRISEVEIDLLLLLEELEAVESVPLPNIVAPATRPDGGPTSLAEMITALSEWNEGEVTANSQGRARFQSRIAANLLGQLAREASMGRDFAFAARDRLKALRMGEGALNDGLADGSVDWRGGPVWDHLRLSTVERLMIDQPRYPGLMDAQTRWFAT